MSSLHYLVFDNKKNLFLLIKKGKETDHIPLMHLNRWYRFTQRCRRLYLGSDVFTHLNKAIDV